MDKQTALNYIEAYFAGRGDNSHYTAALDFLAVHPGRANELYRELARPGGIDCVTCQELMPNYLDQIARSALDAKQREQFLLHLTGCATCAKEYTELASFEEGLALEADIPRFKVPKPFVPFPQRLKTEIERIGDSIKGLKVRLRFAPSGIAEGLSEYEAGQKDELVLLKRIVSAVSVQAKATRTANDSCSVIIWLEGADITQSPAGHNVTLNYQQVQLEQYTDQKGEVTFAAVPIAVLDSMTIEVSLNVTRP